MKKVTFSVFQIVLLATFLVSGMLACKKKTDTVAESPTKSETPKDAHKYYPHAGHYTWNFKVGPVDQTSHLVIYSSTDSIGYAMEGGVYTNNYMMNKVSYTEKDGENRWVGVGKGGESMVKDGKYFVLFFQNAEDNQFKVFKKEFATQKEAEEFPLPSDESTDSHGWNVYAK